MVRLIVNFDNEVTAERFMSWLENKGQENYWEYIQETEDLEGTATEPSAVVHFDYDYDEWVIDTESGDVEGDGEINDFGDLEEEEEL